MSHSESQQASVIASPESDTSATSSIVSYSSRKEKLAAAVQVVRNTGATVGATARHFGLSPTTLARHVDGNVKQKGGQCVFSPEQEQTIVQHLLKLSDWLIPITREQLEYYVQSFLLKNNITVSRFRENKPGKDWSYGFLNRHKSQLDIRRSVLITPRKGLVPADTVHQFFNLLRLQLSGTDAVPPSCIMNYDETNLVNDPGQQRVIVRRGQKNNRRVMAHSKAGFSVMFAGCADGTLMPPYVVYKSTSKAGLVNPKWQEGFPPPLAEYDVSMSGWFKMKQFERWFELIVLPWAQRGSQPKLVVGDNLSAHFSEKVMAYCREYNISFKCFPANTTHFLQPLDIAVFGPMKRKWRSILDAWKAVNPRACYNKQEFSHRLRELVGSFNGETVKAGFKAAGLVPFNVEEALRHLPLKEQPPLDESGADLVNYLKDRTDGLRPEPSKRLNKRPAPGTDLQDRDLTSCVEDLVSNVVDLCIADPRNAPLVTSTEPLVTSTVPHCSNTRRSLRLQLQQVEEPGYGKRSLSTGSADPTPIKRKRGRPKKN